MTEKQQAAIKVLNELAKKNGGDGQPVLTEEHYFLLLDFIIEERQGEPVYVPQPVPYTPPVIQPYYKTTTPFTPPFEVTCKAGQ